MRNRQVEIVLLYEDQAHESFLLGYLLKKGYQDGKIRRARGVGSGKVSVQRHYADNVCGHRSYCAKNQSQTRALVVMIDQDAPSQPSAYLDLDKRLTDAGLTARTPDEHIAVFAPRYSVETWAYHLLDRRRPVDECTDYSRRIGTPECRGAGAEFPTYDPEGCPLPSLATGCAERRRIP